MGLEEKCKGDIEIRSPIVGTFYDSAASSPDEEHKPKPYIEIGSHVTPETVVCEIEAMKVTHQINAGVYGIVKEKLVKNEDAVDIDQTLFRIKPTKKNN